MKQIVRKVKIIGTGSYVPETVYTNKYLETLVQTSDDWVFRNLGIRDCRSEKMLQPRVTRCVRKNLLGPIGSFVASLGRQQIFPAPKSEYDWLAPVSRPGKKDIMPPSFVGPRMAGIIVGFFGGSAAMSDL
ncbi:MAG: hypothetical protein ABSH28_03485 [Acidobacteriota bacterium]|jgi:hypothetical protein